MAVFEAVSARGPGEPLRPPGARLSAEIGALFPHGVVAAELRGPANENTLTESEVRCCATFAPKRVADFAAGRACAHRVLETFGFANFSLLVGGDRRPLWPSGIVGSISHTDGFCGAVAATTDPLRSVGFDAERVGRVTEELWSKLFTSAERAWLETFHAGSRPLAATLLFSAKEAFYKCRFALVPEWLDFLEAEVAVPVLSESGRFAVRLVGSDTSEVFHAGRYSVTGDLVLTGMCTLKN